MLFGVVTWRDTVAARPSMSIERAASAWACQTAMSPIIFSIGVLARRALWRFATPLARPAPRERRCVTVCHL